MAGPAGTPRAMPRLGRHRWPGSAEDSAEGSGAAGALVLDEVAAEDGGSSGNPGGPITLSVKQRRKEYQYATR